MSNKPHLAANFLKAQNEHLLELKDKILGNSGKNGVTKSESADENDVASDIYDAEMALTALGREKNSLYEIDLALRKISDGSYGICEISGEPIPKERLEALPFARYTVACKAQLELNKGRPVPRVPSSFFDTDTATAEDDIDI